MVTMVYCLVVILLVEVIFVYIVYRDILNPSVVFCIVFFISSVNLMTNISIGINISLETIIIISGGVFALFLGTLLTKLLKINIKFKYDCHRYIYTPNLRLFIIFIFNIGGCFYILHEVYRLTKYYAHYIGGLLGSLSVFAEVSKFGGIGLRVGMISTFLSAFLEAEAYVVGYIIVNNIVENKKNSLLIYFCFLTSFLSTFCQGSRGGIFIILALIILYIFLYRRKRKMKKLDSKLIQKVILTIVVSVAIFQFSGLTTGKNWSVSFYEYLSVYLGFPIYNLNIAIQKGIPRAEMMGIASFKGLYKKLLPYFKISIPLYPYLSDFLYLNGHNMGNVYTIYSSLIADFGFVGMYIALIIIGAIMQFSYNTAKKSSRVISLSKILYSYFLTCIAFSFFSNKICENITVFHIYEVIFVVFWIRILTKKMVRL